MARIAVRIAYLLNIHQCWHWRRAFHARREAQNHRRCRGGKSFYEFAVSWKIKNSVRPAAMLQKVQVCYCFDPLHLISLNFPRPNRMSEKRELLNTSWQNQFVWIFNSIGIESTCVEWEIARSALAEATSWWEKNWCWRMNYWRRKSYRQRKCWWMSLPHHSFCALICITKLSLPSTSLSTSLRKHFNSDELPLRFEFDTNNFFIWCEFASLHTLFSPIYTSIVTFFHVETWNATTFVLWEGDKSAFGVWCRSEKEKLTCFQISPSESTLE